MQPTDASSPDSWIGVREAAVRLGLSYGQTLRLVELGILASQRTPAGRWFVTRESVERHRRTGQGPST